MQFSWSPRGALLSQYNSATFLKDGNIVEISNRDLMGTAESYHVMDGYSFVAYPNRNSVPFREAYQIPEAHTVIRGSLRYRGNPALVKALIDLGWIDTQEKPWLKDGMTWAQIQQQLTEARSTSETDLIAKVDEICRFPSSERNEVMNGLKWMGLFSEKIPSLRGNLLDTLSARLEPLCSFEPGERDLVMLQHKFVVEWKDGSKVSIDICSLLGHTDDPFRKPLPLLWSYLESLMAILPWPSPWGLRVGLPRRCFSTNTQL